MFGPPQRIEPGPGQESVWDYPRPPRLEATDRHVRVVFNEVAIVDTRAALRMLETSHPPVYYLPAADVRTEYLQPSARKTFCEFKGVARYFTLTIGDRSISDAVWDYPEPTPHYAQIAGHFALYPAQMDACFIDDELVRAQAGDFYGGWISNDIVGPFKGEPGTWGW
ncbi:hypothetical protein KR51_00018840 [Rubidibacter lacunae KORDI 51-2]|uniref:DUF427 domain-containing protein n=1 Tax=Rubidibacter lacunae KORDI 51-2 TaxID=582515 RepID=U5DAC0_9CHRO|nr:DUF427 domain-containing protein [Rubidibacter lacunae]ERN41523.1 hypothetical protein KR51_00018840 [Rubidibacter lacunae KORDI 51-2]